MGLHDWAAGEVASDTLLDEMSRQGRIICTSATRPGSPVTGMSIYETDNLLTREWNGAAWRTLPKGIIDRVTGSDTGIGGYIDTSEQDVNGSQCSLTVYDSTQEYRLSWNFTLTCPTSSPGSFIVWANKDGSHLGTGRPVRVAATGVDGSVTVTGFMLFTAAAGTYVMDVSIIQTAGAPGEIPAGGDFMVEHLGTQL